MTKFFYGSIIPTDTGAIQYIRNNEKGQDYLLITGRHPDILIPIEDVYTSLEDEWIADSSERHERKKYV